MYDKPLIHYPLEVLTKAGIKEIIVISGAEHVDQMAGYLGSGERFDCAFSYRVQEKPGGIAQALGLAEKFIGDDDVCAILGDNIYFDDLAEDIKSFAGGSHLFLKEVPDAARFGVATMENGVVTSIEEKPEVPKSNMAVTGCYVYDKQCFEVIRHLKPSARGELEITDVSDWYVQKGQAKATVLHDEWIDAGTFESLLKAANLVRERRITSMQKEVTTKNMRPKQDRVLHG